MFAQNLNELYEEPTILYSNQFYGGVVLHSSGLGATMTFGKYKGAQNLRIMTFEFVTMKHEKEIKSFNPVYEDSRSYVLGKVNSMYVIRGGVGRKKILTKKLRERGVEVGYSWMFGPTLGFTKPVYLEIGYPQIPYEYISVEKYDPKEHDFYNIYGRASGLNGLNELSVYPGAFFKFALSFEYSDYQDAIKGLEVGVAVDAYLTEVPIMAPDFIHKNKQVFTTVYFNLIFGRKFNK